MNRTLRLIGGLVALVGLLLLAPRLGLDRYTDPAELRALVESWGNLGPLIFIGISIGAFFANFPETIVFAAGGILFGAKLGFVYSWVASVLGTTGTFLTARYLARDAVQEWFGDRVAAFQRLDERFETDGFRLVLILRVLLNVAPPLNWVIGITKVSTWQYVAGTALGVIPGLLIVVTFGESLLDAYETGNFMTPQLLLPAALFGSLIIVAIVFVRRILETPPAEA